MIPNQSRDRSMQWADRISPQFVATFDRAGSSELAGVLIQVSNFTFLPRMRVSRIVALHIRAVETCRRKNGPTPAEKVGPKWDALE